MVRVGVVGAGGRMGAEVCRAVAAADGLELVAAVDPHHVGEDAAAGGLEIAGELAALAAAEVDVAVDFTRPGVVVDTVRWLLDHEVHAVVGTTGIGPDDLDDLRERASAGPANVLVAPNFAIGAVLMMQFAATAARHLPHVEIVERHHDGKVDAPSGTALRTAELVAEAAELATPVGGDEAHPGARGTTHHGVPVHSMRLPGLVAHQEVQLGGQGETLTIRHDSVHRESFMPGVVLAVRRVSGLDGLVVGLEHLLAE